MNDQYFVFFCERFYPSGGWKDFSASFNTLEESIEHIKTLDCTMSYAHVMHMGQIILEAQGEYDFWKFIDE